MAKLKLKIKDVVAEMDKNYSLIYVDQNDNLSDSLKDCQQVISGVNIDALYEKHEDWITDAQSEGCNDIFLALKRSFKTKYPENIDEVETFFEENDDTIRDNIYNRDDSTPIKDLIRNSGDQVFFYETGVEIPYGSFNVEEPVKEIKKALKIKLADKTFDDELIKLVENSQGGQLVIYFNDDLERWLDWKTYEKPMNISFDGYHLAIIDTMNGSGFNVFIDHKVSFPFNRKRLYLCKTIKNSYTFDTCGMYADWCSSTKYDLLPARKPRNVDKINAETSATFEHMQQQDLYDRVFKSGKCSIGDINITRHRNVEYINNYPCGHKCKDCGTFWID